MKLPKDFEGIISEILSQDSRYSFDAYPFVLSALDYTLEKKQNQGKKRHITGKEFLRGIQEFAPQQFGPMTRSVLNHWGVRQTRDFGEIVFNMVDAGLMGKTEEDSIEDFVDVFDMDEAFGREDRDR